MRGAALLKIWLWSTLFIGCWMSAKTQTGRIDSLRKELTRATGEETRLNTLFALCGERNSFNPDTLLIYAREARSLAMLRHDPIRIALADYYLAFNLVTRGLTDSGLNMTERALHNLRYDGDNREAYVNFSLLKGKALNNLNKPKEGLNVYFPLLAEAEKGDDTLTRISAINGIVGCYVAVSQNETAKQWDYRSIQLFPPHPSLACAMQMNITLGNLSLCYLHLYEISPVKVFLDSAAFFLSQAITQARAYQLLNGLAYNLGLEGTILGYAGKKDEGEARLKESLKLYKEIGNAFYVINAMSVLGNFYGLTNQPAKGVAICKEGIAYGQALKLPVNFFLYGNLADNYKLAGDYRLYGETLSQLVALKDSTYKINSAEALSALQTRYDVQAKENTIIRQKLDLTRKNNLLYGGLAIFLLLLIGTAVGLAIRKKNQAIRLQQLQVEEKRRTVQAVLQAEENERKRIAADLHDGVAQKMVVAKMNLQALENRFPLADGELKQLFDNITSLVEDSCTEVRDLSHNMMPQAFFRSGLTEAVKNLLNKIGDRNLLIKFDAEGSLEDVDENTQIMIYRVLQECIQNVLKHAKATKLDIAVIAEKNELDITVEDNGVGFDPLGNTEGVGLQNIRSRIAFLNGTLDISSRPGSGTLMAFYIPLPSTTL